MFGHTSGFLYRSDFTAGIPVLELNKIGNLAGLLDLGANIYYKYIPCYVLL